MYAAVMRGALLLVALLVPIVVLPWASEPLEIHKQTIVVIGVVIATLAWLGHVVTSKTLRLPQRAVLVLPVVVLLAGLLSPGLTDAPYLSLVGQDRQEYTSLLSLAMFLMITLLVCIQGDDRRLHRQFMSALVLSGAVASIYVALAMLGLLGASFPLTTVGTPNATGIYLVAMSALGCGLWLTSRGEGEHDVLPAGAMGLVVRGGIVLTAIVTLLVALAIDFSGVWVVLLVVMATMLTFALVRAEEFPHFGRFFAPIALCVAALAFLFLPSPFTNPFPAEVGLSHTGTWRIASEVLRSHGALFGNGAGTFAYAYDAFHDASLSMTDFWDVRFDRGASHILTMLATFGVVGAGAYVAFILIVGALVAGKLAREKTHAEWKSTFAPAMAWLALAVAQFVYPSTMTLNLVFWLLSGVLLSQLPAAYGEWQFLRSPRIALTSAFLFVLILVGFVMTLFVSTTRYAADIAFSRALTQDHANADLDLVIADLDRAALTNRFSDVYYRNLGHALLLKTAEVLTEEGADPQFGKDLVSASVNAALRATSLGKANVMNWELQGDVYREIAPLVQGADGYAIAAYQEAIVRSPVNPKYYVDLARAYIVRADLVRIAMEGDDATLAAAAKTTREESLVLAATQLERAIALREAYAPAQYYMAYVLERQGKITDAIASMEYVKATDPYDVGVALQLGLLYLKQGKTLLAKAEFERAIDIAPNYANARWYLASIYEEEGDFAAAIAQVEMIADLDPVNATVAQRLESLRAGKIAEELPPPIEEEPTIVVAE